MGNGDRMPPGRDMDDWLTCFRSGMWRLEYGWKFTPEAHTRYFREFMPLLHKTKHEVLGSRESESWYLVYVGTKPESRGKGYARALIQGVTQKVSGEILPFLYP
jgi:GNAT superfamily N-acetyltransferase